MEVLPPSDKPVLVQWVVDTRTLWPTATKTKQLEEEARSALALLSDDERAGVLRYFHVRDAKMALTSHLLKRLAVARCADVPWSATQWTRDSNGKPVWVQAVGDRKKTVQFNTSHQAGLVVLAAVYGSGNDQIQVGIDVVSPTERQERDRQSIAKEGWPRFVDVYADVLAPGEAQSLKENTATADMDTKLRTFYGLWCLREAYVKMTGEALLAPWLQKLEFRDFAPPSPVPITKDLLQTKQAMVSQFAIQLHRQPVDASTRLCLRSLGRDYMVCTAVRPTAGQTTDQVQTLALEDPVEVLDLHDVVSFAQKRLQPQKE